MPMITIRQERLADDAAREALLDRAYGPSRFTKTSQRLREDRLPALSLLATEDRKVVGTVRLWNIAAGPGRAALLLGPLAVDPAKRSNGVGAALMSRAIEAAKNLGHQAVLLVGDGPYYERFGFSTEKTGSLWMPGPYEQKRLLGLELVPGALNEARGLIAATGALAPKPDLAALVAAETRAVTARTRRAA
jgi:predicted N-acetyltransferase YhbS